MPEERDIEKQLRAAAGQRRGEAGGKFELHPATRRLLQGEVLRTLGRNPGAARRKTFFGLTWMRFATATCAVTVLCFGTWALLHDPRQPAKQQLAMADNKPASAAKMETAGYVQTAAPAIVRRDRAAEQRFEPAPLAASPAAIAPVVVVKADSASKLLDEDLSVALEGRKKIADATFAFAAPAASAAKPAAEKFAYTTGSLAKSEAGAFGGTFADSPAESKLREVDKLSVAGALAAAKDAEQTVVLANFNVTQRGDRIRIVDGDGSVYDGVLLAEEDAKKSKALAVEAFSKKAGEDGGKLAFKEVAAAALRQQNSQNFFFRAAGTNLSLRQNVAITGQFMNAASPAKGAQNYLNAAQNQSQRQAQLLKNGVLISNGRITGKAVTTDGREFTLDAESVSP